MVSLTPLATLLALAGAPLAVADDAVADFERYYKQYEDTPSRIEAVLTLQGRESPRVVDGLQIVFKDDDPGVWAAAVRVLGGFQSRPPVERMLELLQETNRESLRVGLLRSLASGEYGGTLEAVQPLVSDSSWPVRMWSLRALAASRDPAGVPLLFEACNDAETAVRCAALEGLAHMGRKEVLAPARADLHHPVWQVRACAVRVLGDVRDVGSIGPLVARMQEEEGRLLADIDAALGRLTGRDFGPRPEAWKRFWDTYADRFVLPTDADLARLSDVRAARAASYEHGLTSYHGIETPSEAMLFLIDVSASMEHEVANREAFPDHDAFRRIDIAKAELIRVIDGLGSDVEFNVVAFATDVMPWKKDLVSSTKGARESAKRWIDRLEPITGATEDDIAAPANLATAEGGKTNSYGALAYALRAAGRGVKDKYYEVGVDTIFFLTDGEPTTGQFVFSDDIVREIDLVNSLRRVVIHTIAIGEFEKGFMQRLAARNGGTFVDLGG